MAPQAATASGPRSQLNSVKLNCALGFDTKPILLASYVTHGARRATANQFERPAKGAGVLMALLILGEMAGFAVVVTGVVFGQLV